MEQKGRHEGADGAEDAGSACPVKHMWSGDQLKSYPLLHPHPPPSSSSTSSSPPSSGQACPAAASTTDSTASSAGSACPVAVAAPAARPAASSLPAEDEGCGGGGQRSGGEALDPKNQMPAQPNQLPAPGQRAVLPTQRRRSSIPKAGDTPASGNQPAEEEVWLYPSPQMFYNAMRRKGWDPREEDMVAVVSIHNAVNERTWSQVLEWERLHESECKRPQLARFRGRPRDLSPKARMMGWIGYKPPFDRHDWIVDRCGKEVRYVIDFYQGEAREMSDGSPAPSSFYLDVRPALDSVESAFDRVRMGLHSTFSSVFARESSKEKDLK